MQRWDEIDRYVIVTSDAHGGAAMADYKPYLAGAWRDEFDRGRAGVVNRGVDRSDRLNSASAARPAARAAGGAAAEVISPNPLPPFFDILAHLSGVPRDRDAYDRKWAGLRAHN